MFDMHCRPPIPTILLQRAWGLDKLAPSRRIRGYRDDLATSPVDLAQQMLDFGVTDTMIVYESTPDEDPHTLYDRIVRELTTADGVLSTPVISLDLTRVRDVIDRQPVLADMAYIRPGVIPSYTDDTDTVHAMAALCTWAADTSTPLAIMVGGSAAVAMDSTACRRLDEWARRFDRTQFVVMHGAYPRFDEALAVVLRRRNVWLVPDMYFPDFPRASDIVHAVQGFGRERILYGSCYPYVDIGEHLTRCRDLISSEAAWQAFTHDNAAALLGR